MNFSILDVETNGLLYGKKVATKIHCMCAFRVHNGVTSWHSFTDYNEMREFLLAEECLIGHNIIRFDVPVLEKILGIDLSSKRQIDTLALSWYLYPNRHEHGIEAWGVDLGLIKPVVEDWENASIETYLFRCTEDVRINIEMFNLIAEYLKQLYDNVSDAIDRLVNYLMFKMKCAREQEEQKWRLDIDKCKANLEALIKEREDKITILIQIMPKVTKYRVANRPKVCFKKDGSPSEHGKKWFALLEERGLPEHHVGAIKIPISEEDGNPGSHQQVKDWLFSLGWQPDHIKKVKDDVTKETREVPQISNAEGTDVSDSVKELYEQVPELVHLEGLFVIRHRITILEGFLKNVDDDGYLRAQVKGFTNTLRFQHTTLVNIPQIPKPYWEQIRECLITDPGYELCGSDMGGLEDNTKHHYMMFFDPDAVNLQRTPNFDAHINMAVVAKYISWDEGEFYKWYDKRKEGIEHNYIPYKDDNMANSITGLNFEQLKALPDDRKNSITKEIKPLRLKSKKVNFAAVYGAGPPKLAETAKVPLNEARDLHKAYWIINRAVKQVADACITKNVGNQMWLFNPVSKFWYSLREEKDRFSTLNQGTGVYCFDTWVRYVRSFSIKLVGQFHDEIIFRLPLNTRDQHKQYLTTALDYTNNELRLNVPLRISVDFGNTYAQIH